ncbi:MAG: MerR family DNA-binding protein [Myxococcales bacterium]
MEPRTRERSLKTGEVAARAGVGVETLRYYERRGLLPEPPRRGSYRAYTPADAQRVRFIKRAQELGFSLREIEELLRLRDDRRGSCGEVRAAARAKIAEIDHKLQSLRAIRGALEKLAASCRSDGSVRECPILEALDRVPEKEPRP